MPRYIFSIRDDEWLCRDEVETLPDLAAARAEALNVAGRIIRDLNLDRRDVRQMRVEITDCAGDLLLSVPFFHALGVEARRPRRWRRLLLWR